MSLRLTKKSYKRRKIVVGVTAFMSVALVSTGFASFVIASTSTKNVEGAVQVGKISDASLTISITEPTAKNFCFEPQATDVSGRVQWDGTNSENLTLTISGSVSNYDHLGTFTVKMSETFKENEDTTDRIAAAVDAGYIVAPACYNSEVTLYDSTLTVQAEVDGLTLTADSNNNKLAFEYVVSFSWGTKFGSMNPGLYYDTDATGKAVSDDAMKEALVKFRNTIYGTSDTVEGQASSENGSAPTYEILFTAKAK
jgi:hypothetical protein